MASLVKQTALTTLERVKARLTLTTEGFDIILSGFINSASDFIETYCNRKFVSRDYEEIISVDAHGQEYLFTKGYPIEVNTLTAFYSTGTPSNKSWLEYNTDNFEVCGNGESGMVRFYGGLPKGTNTVKVVYTAGYVANWENYGVEERHTLPMELTDLCERLATAAFKRRDSEGRSSESFNGNSVSWDKSLSEVDKEILNKYKRLPAFM